MGQLITTNAFDQRDAVLRRAAANRQKDSHLYEEAEPETYRKGFLLLVREWVRLVKEWAGGER